MKDLVVDFAQMLMYLRKSKKLVAYHKYICYSYTVKVSSLT